GDRRRGLLENSSDAIGSVANFLQRHGWAPGQPVVEPADAGGTLYTWSLALGLEPVLRVRDWLAHGVLPQRKNVSTENGGDSERQATLITLEGAAGPLYFLGYNNFYVITRYNRSKNYAMA